MIHSSADQPAAKKGEGQMDHQSKRDYIWKKQCQTSIRTIGKRLDLTTQQVRELYDEAFLSGEYKFPK